MPEHLIAIAASGAVAFSPIGAMLLRAARGGIGIRGTGRALAAGASEDEIAEVLLVIAPVAGLSRVVSAAPDVAIALGYDVETALEEPDC